MTPIKQSVRKDVAHIWEALNFVFKSDKHLFATKVIFIAFQSVLPLISLILLKLLVDSISNNLLHPESIPVSKIWLYTALFCGVFILTRTIGVINQLTEEVLSHKLVDFISNLMHKKSTELDLSFYDNPLYHDTFHRAQQEASHRPLQLLNSLTGILRNTLSLLGLIALLSAFSWWLIAIMLLAGAPGLWVKLIKSKLMYSWRKANTSLFRKSGYFSLLLTSRVYAKEVRIYKLADYLQKQYISIRKTIVKQMLAISVRRTKLDIITVFFEAGALFLIILLLSRKAFAGAITIGAFVMFFEAFRRGQGFVQGLVGSFTGLYDNKLFLNNLFEFLKLQPQVKSPQNPLKFPLTIKQGIRFDNVSFKYPGTDKMVLNELNISFKPGEISRIQGENGAGKTTLIKLICRLYDCNSGGIYIDGVSIKDLDLLELRKNISVIFQDFVQYDLSVKDNIVFGDLEQPVNNSRLENSAHISSAQPIIDDLPKQYETILGRFFEGGEELSMGQWQRIALARALYSHTPILILDEPTSWMDDKAKKHFYENLPKLKEGRIVLLISHSANSEMECNIIDSGSTISDI